MIIGMMLTALSLAGMIGWALHEIRRVDGDKQRSAADAATTEDPDGEG